MTESPRRTNGALCMAAAVAMVVGLAYGVPLLVRLLDPVDASRLGYDVILPIWFFVSVTLSFLVVGRITQNIATSRTVVVVTFALMGFGLTVGIIAGLAFYPPPDSTDYFYGLVTGVVMAYFGRRTGPRAIGSSDGS